MSCLTERRLVAPRSESLLPSGIYRVHIPSENEHLGLRNGRKVAEIVDANARWAHLEREFFGEEPHGEHDYAITATRPWGKGRTRVLEQGSPYGDRNAMVVATHLPTPSKEQLHFVGEYKIRTRLAQELDRNVETAYQGGKLGILSVAHEQASRQNNGDVAIVIENRTTQVSQQDCALPRTVVLPHATGVIVDAAQIGPGGARIESLAVEQDELTPEIVTGLASIMYGGIMNEMQEQDLDPDGIKVFPQVGIAKGYGIHFVDIAPRDLTRPDTIRYVTDVLHAEHDVYRNQGVDFIKDMLPETKVVQQDGAYKEYPLKPQPASRQVLHMVDGRLTATKFPITRSRAGLYEAHGIELVRSSANPLMHDRYTIVDFQTSVGKQVEEIWDSLE